MALDAKQLAELLKLRAIGWSQKDIAEAIGQSQPVSYTHLTLPTILLV